MKTIKDLVGTRKGEKAVIICAGASVRAYQHKIQEFIDREGAFTIGINNITSLFTPDYHLWTNTKRFRDFGKHIMKDSKLLLGKGIHIKTIREIIGNRKYFLINFTDMKEGVPIDYKNGKIFGFYRTAGNLAIMVAHLMGASHVDIVGVDGHTFYNYDDIKNGKQPHHCYDEKYEPFSYEVCVKKDRITNMVLKNLREYGIHIRILTPTVHQEFFNPVMLRG
jgi:hypothetical protein